MVSEQVEGIGRADPIKSHFYDYVRNEHKGGMNQADKFLPKRFFYTKPPLKMELDLVDQVQGVQRLLNHPLQTSGQGAVRRLPQV